MAPSRPPVRAKAAFFAQYASASEEVQTAVNSELLVVSRAPSTHGSIYAASWDEPIRWVVVASSYGLYWRDEGEGAYEVLALLLLPSRLLV